MNVVRHTFKNGLKAIIIEMPDSALVATSLFVGAGSRYENHDNFGISHFVEHMAFKGTEKYPNYEVLALEIEKVGGDQNAGTSKDNTYYVNILQNRFYKKGFDVVAQLASKMIIDPEELEKEKGVIIEEINKSNDEPADRAIRLLGELMWGEHPLCCDILGPKSNIQKFTRQDFIDYITPLYVAENMTVAVAGGIKADEVLPELEKSLSIIPTGPKVIPIPVSMEQEKHQLAIDYFDSEQAYVLYAFKTISHHDPRRYALDVLMSILGKGMGSSLFKEIREKRGLAYTVSGFSRYMADGGFTGVFAGLNKDKAVEGLRVIKEELYKAKTELFSAEEIERGKEYLKGTFLIHNLESTEGIAYYYGRKELLYPDAPVYQDRDILLDAVTAEDIRQAAIDFFVDEKQNLAIVGPFKDKEMFAKILENK